MCTWNLEAYVDAATKTRFIKSEESKAKIRECLRTIRPHVLALEEVGSLSALVELQQSLAQEGLSFPYREQVGGFDTNIHIAVLSRYPIIARRPHTNDTFLLSGRRFRVSRGIAELDIQINANYSFTLFAAHLKSKRPIGVADADELRLEEAKVLREKVDHVFSRDPQAQLVVLGDFNDTPDAKSTKAIIGRGKHKLVDTRPSERNGDSPTAGSRSHPPRTVAWTHFYPAQDTYSRLDYILLSPAMAKAWVTNETFVLASPNWGVASDHRPLLATFDTGE